MSQAPLLSVIIPSFNRGPYLDQCLTSVFREIDASGIKAEVLVVDGKSTDDSLEILQKHASRLAFWVSEPDHGVADAVNKGLAQARGELVHVIGADDEVVAGAYGAMAARLAADPTLDILIGRAEFFTEDAAGIRTPAEVEQPVGPITEARFLQLGERGFGWPSPEVAITRRRLYVRVGGFNLDYRYMAYLEFWLRATRAGARCEGIEQPVARRYLTPSSDTMKGARDVIDREHRRLLWQYGGLGYFVRRDEIAQHGLGAGAAGVIRRLGWYTGVTPRTWARRLLRARP